MFVLDESSEATHVSLMDIGMRWRELAHVPQRTRAMILLAGESISTPWIKTSGESMLAYEFFRGLPKISADGLDASIHIESEDGARELLAMHRLSNLTPDAGRVSCELRLSLPEGRRFKITVGCDAGPEGDPSGDWLAVNILAFAPLESLPLAKASSNKAWRLANEIEHFKTVYSGAFYRYRQISRSGAEIRPIRKLDVGSSEAAVEERAIALILDAMPPQSHENAFIYSNRLLDALLPIRPPNFVDRLRQMHRDNPGRPVRMLSLCAGEAATEGWILEVATVPVELCLLDVHEGLLEAAASRMPANVVVDRVLGDANGLNGQLGRFDVINITSGLHHLVELERVLSGISKSLDGAGEFWLIGEQVGRNGNRLWPEALREANSIFSRWPESKRINANTGQMDASVPDVDFSSACFEGIRSQDILPLLQRYFIPVDVYVRNCFLWRLFDVAYASNFDLFDNGDLSLIRSAVNAEYQHWVEGGSGTEMHAVYRSKFVARPSVNRV